MLMEKKMSDAEFRAQAEKIVCNALADVEKFRALRDANVRPDGMGYSYRYEIESAFDRIYMDMITLVQVG